MNKPLKILHTCETALGGVGIYQKNLALMPTDQFDQVFSMPEAHAKIMPDDPRVKTYTSNKRGLLRSWMQFRQLRSLARSQAPDVILYHSSFSLLALFLMKLSMSKTASIYCSHGWAAVQYGDGLKAKLVGKVEGLLCGLADKVMNVSQNDLEFAISNGYHGVHVLVENGVPDRRQNVVSDLFKNEPVNLHLLFVGRFDRQKGLDVLLKAFALVQQQRKDIILHIVGASVREEVEFDIPEGVRFSGWVSSEQIDDWYASAHALVVSSRWEGLPLVIPEALRNGTPVIASRRSGMGNLFENGKTGLSFDLDVQDIANCLLLLSKNDLTLMRSDCRKLYEDRYSTKRVFTDLARVVRSLKPKAPRT